jgi:hypothetical protein
MWVWGFVFLPTLHKVITSVDETIFTFQENLQTYFQIFAKFWKTL